MSKFPLDRAAKFYVAGHRGMVGSAIVRQLQKLGFTALRRSTQANFRKDLKNVVGSGSFA